MNKAQLGEVIARELNLSKVDGEKAINLVVDTIIGELKRGGEVALTGFGTFSVKQRAARVGINPKNPSQKIQIPAKKAPKFKAGKNLKEALN